MTRSTTSTTQTTTTTTSGTCAATADGEWADEVDEGSSDRGHESAEISAAELGRRLPRLGERRLSERVPALYPLAVRYHRVRRRVQWMRSDTEFTRSRMDDDLPVRVKRHRSLLMRQLSETEPWMQRNNVINLKLACAQVDGLLIRPGETFSFNQVVGNATRRKGYVRGMRLSNGKARPGIGGGTCRLANLLHWMVLHSPLTVTECSADSFDLFPDTGRVLPWGVGCSIVYNYVDLQVRNDTDRTFQLHLCVGDRYLEGEILADAPTESSYRVFARGEHFLRARVASTSAGTRSGARPSTAGPATRSATN
jgi:vancomycin resistance protein VanW